MAAAARGMFDDEPLRGFRAGDRVQATSGETGRIIGFYVCTPPTALVALDSGDSREIDLTALNAV